MIRDLYPLRPLTQSQSLVSARNPPVTQNFIKSNLSAGAGTRSDHDEFRPWEENLNQSSTALFAPTPTSGESTTPPTLYLFTQLFIPLSSFANNYIATALR
jgi:hypothetical protein